MKSSLLALCVSVAWVANAQTQKPPVQRPQSQKPQPQLAQPLISCPSDAKEGCDSFNELWKAGDTTIKPDVGDFGLVCFRQKEDAFLLFIVSSGLFDVRQRNNDGVADIPVWNRASGNFEAFKDGVENADDTVPRNLGQFVGTWTSFTKTAPFSMKRPSDAFYLAKSEDNDGVFVSVNGTSTAQLNSRYTNINEQEVSYDFNIQLATGRFVETHSIPNSVPTRKLGRCVPLPKGK